MISLQRSYKITIVILAHYKFVVVWWAQYPVMLVLFKVELYEDFSRSQAKKEVDNVLMVDSDQPQTNVPSQQTHVFQVRQNFIRFYVMFTELLFFNSRLYNI